MPVTNCEEWPLAGYSGDGVDAGVLAIAKNSAQAFLSGLTMDRLGVCTYEHRFQVRSTGRGVCLAPRPLGECCAIKLPRAPVRSIASVTVDGVEQPVDSYRMVGNVRLARVSGCWPQSPDCEPGRIVVTYDAGLPLEEGSKWHGLVASAMGEVTREYVNALTGQACKLPSRFTAVQRQGVSTVALDPALFLNLGLTGMPLTDNLRRTLNPNGLRRKPRVLSIDGARRH